MGVKKRPAPEGEDQLVSPSVAASLLDVRSDSLNRWAKEGRIAFVLLPSGHRKYRLSVIRSFLEAHEVET